MTRVAARLATRLTASLLAVFVAITAVFFLGRWVPGDPTDLIIGDQATSVDRAALSNKMGLDKSARQQYMTFIRDLVHFDLGRSLTDGGAQRRPATQLIAQRMPATFELATAAILAAVIIAVPLGVYTSQRESSAVDRVVQTLSLAFGAMPSFWLGPIFVAVFSIRLQILPISESGTWRHLVLPTLTLACGLASVLTQITRSAMHEALRHDYFRTARAKGLSQRVVIWRHAFRNALPTVITTIGLQASAVFTGVVVVETVFDWPGLGTLLYRAIQQRDYPVIQGCVLTVALISIAVQLLTDIAQSFVDARTEAL